MRMARVNITVPDEVVTRARSAGLNVSRVATAALVDELDRRAKIEALDAYLAEFDVSLGPVTEAEQVDAVRWVDGLFDDAPASGRREVPGRRRA